MKVIPFDIEKAKSGKYKIQTRGGYPARIICWDKKDSTYTLVALITFKDGCESVTSFTKTGIYCDWVPSSPLDLVLVDESAPNIRRQIYDTIIKTYKDYPNLTCDVQLSTLLLADLIQEGLKLPKWKRIYKGERLPETSYIKSDFHSQSFMPCMKGVEMGSDCWYLPVTALNELENEEQKN